MFLDANVLFSAAYREHSGLLKLWELEGTPVFTSWYAAAEARRNLYTQEQRARLDEIMQRTELIVEGDLKTIDDEERLPKKDRPILRAAVFGRATHLITGDFTHFGPFYGERLQGVIVMSPSDYLASSD